jgi:hypothetical protein
VGAYLPVINHANLVGVFFNDLSFNDLSSRDFHHTSLELSAYHFGGESAGKGYLIHLGAGWGWLTENLKPPFSGDSSKNGIVGLLGVGYGAAISSTITNYLKTVAAPTWWSLRNQSSAQAS